MSIALFNAVPTGAIETLYDDQKQPWFKQVDVGDFVGIVNMRDATCNLSLQDKKSRDEITVGGTDGSYKPPKHAKPHDGFISVNGVTTVLVNSRKSKARQVTAWIIHDIIPRGFNKIIEEKQKTIEQFHTDVHESDIQLQAMNDENVDLHAEIDDLVVNRHVPRIDDIDTVLCAFVKNKHDEEGRAGDLPYYMVRCQKRNLDKQISTIMVKYPNMRIRGEYEDANAIHHWCYLKKEILGKEHSFFNHFTLVDDQRDLFEGRDVKRCKEFL